MTNLTLSIFDYIFKFQIRNFLNFALNFMYKICTYPKFECVKFIHHMSKIWTYICTNFRHNKNIKEKNNRVSMELELLSKKEESVQTVTKKKRRRKTDAEEIKTE